MSKFVNTDVISDKDIGGMKLTISIAFTPNDTRKYEDISTELLDRIEDAIESLGQEVIVGFSKPILKDDLSI